MKPRYTYMFLCLFLLGCNNKLPQERTVHLFVENKGPDLEDGSLFLAGKQWQFGAIQKSNRFAFLYFNLPKNMTDILIDWRQGGTNYVRSLSPPKPERHGGNDISKWEAIVYLYTKCLKGGKPITGTVPATDAAGSFTDNYYTPFITCCCSGPRLAIVKQTLTAGGVSATLYTTIDEFGAWSGNLRSVFH